MSDNSVDVSEDEEQLAAAVSRDMQDMEHARSEQAKNLKEVRKAIVQREDELENNNDLETDAPVIDISETEGPGGELNENLTEDQVDNTSRSCQYNY